MESGGSAPSRLTRTVGDDLSQAPIGWRTRRTNVQTTRAYRRRLGDYEITSLSDGFVDLSNAVWQGIDPSLIDELIDARYLFKGEV